MELRQHGGINPKATFFLSEQTWAQQELRNLKANRNRKSICSLRFNALCANYIQSIPKVQNECARVHLGTGM